MNLISDILYWISTGLLVPVIVLLIFFFIRALILIGTFFGQYMQNKKSSSRLYSAIESNAPSSTAEFAQLLPVKPDSLLSAYAHKMLDSQNDCARIDLLISEYEIAADKNIATSKVLTKMGPILGLMGTLIPMGPALVGLATGDIASMAYNMQVAFATTVVGLVVSAIGFLTQMVKERWAVRDITMLEFLANMIRNKEGGKR
ncbi:MotA/TolQ/ExbB proton channel family protein [Xylanibacter muris]|uniref:MotA/TolQ/ExbB proton channel family protein n=1 Tax=Xylanibacter muris TaxID=2736290 RepID=A0ABX2AJI7_9BACT|nr:MotA/TolQ/ExbB proton channel family protein [Xylanibacter muris]NPD90958.1 MotA/TolQ/ExbB proton channel family protein [Xylanibacter muris]